MRKEPLYIYRGKLEYVDMLVPILAFIFIVILLISALKGSYSDIFSIFIFFVLTIILSMLSTLPKVCVYDTYIVLSYSLLPIIKIKILRADILSVVAEPVIHPKSQSLQTLNFLMFSTIPPYKGSLEIKTKNHNWWLFMDHAEYVVEKIKLIYDLET